MTPAPRVMAKRYDEATSGLRWHVGHNHCRFQHSSWQLTGLVSRLFAAQGPPDEHPQLRLTASRKALLEGRASSITEVAIDHGFKDVSHFRQAFRKAFGCSPTSLTKKTAA